MESKYYIYSRNNLFLHYNIYQEKYYFKGGFEDASKFYSKEAVIYFQQNTINNCPELQGGKWYLMTATIEYKIEEVDFLK